MSPTHQILLTLLVSCAAYITKAMDLQATLNDFESYRIDADFSDTATVQSALALTGQKITQTWKRVRPLGTGGFGQVWQESWQSENGDWQYRAVKVCSQAQMLPGSLDYKRELAALAALSSSRVKYIKKPSRERGLISPVFRSLRSFPWMVDRLEECLLCHGIPQRR